MSPPQGKWKIIVNFHYINNILKYQPLSFSDDTSIYHLITYYRVNKGAELKRRISELHQGKTEIHDLIED